MNLGAIGKGYALDRAAEVLQDAGVEDFLLHGGRSSVLARGSNAAAELGAGGWTVSLEDPLRPGRTLAEFTLRNAALGTSGTAAQFFRHGGRRYGHILDPRCGQPAEGMFSATVVAPTAAEADALSTAFYVLGPDRTAEYCGRHPGIAALLVAASPDRNASRVAACNFAEGALRLR
jgi:thiamine biosynthesis lipoprotein